MKNITLTGHSGCKLEIEERDGNFIVIKTARDKDYSHRLHKQHVKQKEFEHGIFHAPAVLDSGYDEQGVFKFSMEYVNGFTLAEYFKKADVSAVTSIAQKFLHLIPKNYVFDTGAKEVFSAKITELEQKISTSGNDTLKKAFQQLKKYDWKHCIAGYCHGDLALENIIWKNGDLYLIDFLDSFYDSWMIDFAKLLLDVECLWSYRLESAIDENLKIRLSIFKHTLLEKIRSLPEGEELIRTLYYLQLLHLLRIMPYAKEEHTKKYLQEGVNKIHGIIKSL